MHRRLPLPVSPFTLKLEEELAPSLSRQATTVLQFTVPGTIHSRAYARCSSICRIGRGYVHRKSFVVFRLRTACPQISVLASDDLYPRKHFERPCSLCVSTTSHHRPITARACQESWQAHAQEEIRPNRANRSDCALRCGRGRSRDPHLASTSSEEARCLPSASEPNSLVFHRDRRYGWSQEVEANRCRRRILDCSREQEQVQEAESEVSCSTR